MPAASLFFLLTTLGGIVAAPLRVLSWNVHWQCGSNFLPGCREAATRRFAELARDFNGRGTVADAVVAIELEATSDSPADLASGFFSGWTQVNGSCPGSAGATGDAAALLLAPSYKVLRSSGGCLGGDAAGGYHADARAFAVAMVQPPAAVRGCPQGLCFLGLHAPHVNVTRGAATVADVCGAARAGCTVAAGDWNAPVGEHSFCNYTASDRWTQLLGGDASTITVAVPDQLSCCFPNTKYNGWDDHVLTDVVGASVGAAARVLPYQMASAFSNDTEEHMPIKVELELPTVAPAASPFDVEDANRTLHLAYAAFCNETAIAAWNCQWCNGTNTFAEPLEMTSYLKDKKAGTQGYVAVDRPRRRVVVAYRGSKNLANDIEDADFILTKFPFGPEGLKVDNGFLQAYKSVRTATAVGVQAALRKCGSDCGVLFTGHSLGAAMATIAAAELGGPDSPPVRLFTFGCPRVGDAAFVSWAYGRLQNTSASFRMRRQKDIVTAIPPRSIGYAHLPGEVWNKHLDKAKHQTIDSFVTCDGSGEDPACGDSEEHPPFPLDLIHLSGAEHTRYMGFQGGNCWCGTAECK